MTQESDELFETIKEEVKASVAGRFSSPFIGAFMVSWLFWNHRAIFVLFADMAISDRFRYIDEHLYPTLASFVGLNLAGPLLSALFYIFVLPWPTEWVHRWNLQRKLRLRYAEQLAEKNRLLTEREGEELRADSAQLKEKLTIRREQLHEARTRIRALSMKLMAEVGTAKQNELIHDYLVSQPFVMERVGAGDHSEVTFHADGAVKIDKLSGNLRWSAEGGQLLFIDADAEDASFGRMAFSQSLNLFEGNLATIGNVRVRGARYHGDFDIS